MKAFVIALAMSFAASAGEFSSYQRILFQTASTYVPANKVCTEGGNLFHKGKTEIGVEYCSGGSNDRANCHTVFKPLVQPMQSTAQRCARFTGHDQSTCATWETYSLNQGPTVKIDIWASEMEWSDGKGHSPLRVETFVLPACGGR